MGDEDNNSPNKWKSNESMASNGSQCRCLDPKCQIKKKPFSLNNLDKVEAASNTYLSENPELIRLSGGPDLASKVLQELEEIVSKDPTILEPNKFVSNDTILIQKCCMKTSTTDTSCWRELY